MLASPALNPPLTGDLDVDVAIIGAGVSGLTCAFLLARSGRRVAVFEKNQIASGESGFTTGHLTEVFDRGYAGLIADFGADAARGAAAAGRAALDMIARIVAQEEIECEFVKVPAYLYSETGHEDEALLEEWEAVRRVGIRCSHVGGHTLGELPFPVHSALRYEDQAQFHPVKYLRALAARARERGVEIYENSPVTRVEEGEPCYLETAGGRVRAGLLIVSANVPLHRRYSLHAKLSTFRSYAIAVRSPAAETMKGLYWDSMQPYHYSRTVAGEVEGRPERLLLIGGEDHRTGARERTDKSYRELELFAREYFQAREVVARWSGQIVESLDGLPYIGRTPHARNIFLATGFGGQGMTMGTAAGIVLSDLVLGARNEWETLFSPRRFHPLKSAGRYLARQREYPQHFLRDRWARRHALPLSTVPAGEGRIVKVGGETVAVYRDETSAVHALSPVCSHMGCQVHWNRGEKSWDCPCHGSRFGIDGEVLNGPAMENLRKIDLDELNRSGRRRRHNDTAA